MPHIHEKIDFTATVFVVYKNKVLLRLHDKYKKWLGVGGHVELDEEPNQAAVREVKEEVGLDVVLVGKIPDVKSEAKCFRELLPPRFMNIHYVNDTHQHMDMIYFAKSDSDDVRPEGDDISTDWRWLTKEELEKNELGIREHTLFYALEALKQVVG